MNIKHWGLIALLTFAYLLYLMIFDVRMADGKFSSDEAKWFEMPLIFLMFFIVQGLWLVGVISCWKDDKTNFWVSLFCWPVGIYMAFVHKRLDKEYESEKKEKNGT